MSFIIPSEATPNRLALPDKIHVLMDDKEGCCSSRSTLNYKRDELQKALGLKFPASFLQAPQRLKHFLKSHFKNSAKDEREVATVSRMGKEPSAALETDLDKQLKSWRENPTWANQPPELKVTIPKGSLCNLNVKVEVGLPPDAIYNIVIDPENRRVFKNVKEVISRRVLVDEGSRQVVEVEQAAMWRFLWWSGTISVHVSVDQNREDHSVKFKQLKTGFMKRFEGRWTVEPLFVDEKLCFPFKPRTLADYNSCTGGKGRVGSIVSLEQLIEPAILPPPPLSWYLRGITTRTTEMLISDLAAEAARIRGDGSSSKNYSTGAPETSEDSNHENPVQVQTFDVKERWRRRRRNMRHCNKSRGLCRQA